MQNIDKNLSKNTFPIIEYTTSPQQSNTSYLSPLQIVSEVRKIYRLNSDESF